MWYRSADHRLGANALQAVDSALRANEAIVSAISFWEIGMLIHKGRFALEMGLSDWRRSTLDEGLVEVQVDGEIGLTAGLLPHQHGDPADRLIVATAIRSGATLLTADELVLRWNEPFNRQDARV